MSSLLIIRLHPVEPVSGNDFTAYLNGLFIKAYDLSYNSPDGSANTPGTASYEAPTLPPSPSPNPTPVPNTTSRITQHFNISVVSITPPLKSRQFFSAATAVIEIPTPPDGEYRTADIRLDIIRGVNEIIHKQTYYNVPVASGPLPNNPNNYPGLPTTSLHLALPAPGQQAAGLNLARAAAAQQMSSSITMSNDGSVPNFASLRAAVENVLNVDPGNTTGIADLTMEKCRHIAYEITWDRTAFPLPNPTRPLEEMYTGPHSSDSEEENHRRQWEGQLQTYYARHNGEADRLSNYIFCLSAAIWCEDKSGHDQQAGFYLPVFPAAPNKEAKVILKGPGAFLTPTFRVPAEYFYALTVSLPPQISRPQRFKMCAVDTEEQVIDNIQQAITDHVITEPGVNHFQAARRLRALSLVGEAGTPVCVLTPATPAHGLVTNWLSFIGPDINTFWAGLSTGDITGHLDILLVAVTRTHVPLMNAIKAPGFGVTDATDLPTKTTHDWDELLTANPTLLPDFTKPGTTDERIQAFISHLRKYFDVTEVFDSADAPTADALPGLEHPAGNPLDELLDVYPGFSFSGWDPTLLANALSGIFPGDTAMQQQFTQWLTCLKGVIQLTNGITPPKMQLSVMEALWARGFTNAQSIQGFSFQDFQEALVGSVAYGSAEIIWSNAKAGEPRPEPGPAGFKPVNPDGSIVNCIPPAHLSPFGPISYLHDMLQVSEKSTCENPFPEGIEYTLAQYLGSRRGPLGSLLASQSNLEVPIPLIDIVNESLEHMVADGGTAGSVYNTAAQQVGGHELTSSTTPTGACQHDPTTLLEALPEHSTPAVPTAEQTAYDKLKNDFSTCALPYNQPLDVSRSYLEQMGTSRFAVMRRFRKNITEFVLDPTKETAEFQKHLWRYPVRIETAIEYLHISPEENYTLFQNNIVNTQKIGKGKIALYQLYGFPAKQEGKEKEWTQTVILVSEFLQRTCLTYCEFIQLWKSEFVKFGLKGKREEKFPDCEPCCLDKYIIEFIEPSNPVEALTQLAIFIRLWRKLQTVHNARYTISELRDICLVLKLFIGNAVNPDFIRQLAAFQMFRDDFKLSLTDGTTPVPGTIGAERMHLLAFWAPAASHWNWAVEHLLNQIQQYAIDKHGCCRREPEFIKLIKNNLDPLSALAGFDPANPADTWQALPTHTLRFAEILAKIYASEFHVGELLFLFTSADHLQGDDPFPLQTVNEALDSPLGLPDDEDQNSLLTLRSKLMAVTVDPGDAQQWTWARMETVLKEEFAFIPPPGNNRWLSLGQHFFPGVLTAAGMAVNTLQRQYRKMLTSPTSELMWNTPPDGPFHYDAAVQELWTQVPITDEAVLAKLGRIRQLSPAEQHAVQDLYFLPRVDLAHFSFIFNNFKEAEERLLREPDESVRWTWFREQFALFYQRCHVIAEHLAAHTADAIGSVNPEGVQVAQLLLKNLWADENKATAPWENDNGQTPPVTWQPQPNGGAYAALLGLTGTGLRAEYFDAAGTLRWRELRGGVDAFGPEENAWNAPIPTILPGMNFTFTPQQLQYAAVRNGFAMANDNGAMLGGAEPFTLRWQGLLMIQNEGSYGFSAGAPTPAGLVPDFEKAHHSHHWRVTLERGQKTWILLSRHWPNEEAPAHCSKPISLKKGFYRLTIELERKPFFFDGPEDVHPRTTGFQLKYKGPDAGTDWLALPYDKLFQDSKDASLPWSEDFPPGAAHFLAAHYISTVRDMRRTYQRAFKTMLLVHRLHLSAQPMADDGQSELGYLLAHPVNFVGQAYYRSGSIFVTHRANFDPNFLPVLDNYEAPPPAQDQRTVPTAQRRQAMFDWVERLFDYTVMRRYTQRSPEQPVWLLFHEAAETHADNPAHLLRHLNVDLRHDDVVLQYFDATQVDLSYDVTGVDLEDDRCAVRVWHSERWVEALLFHFYAKDIAAARVFLWASDGPEIAGNANLAQFYRDGCIENGEPRRYKEIKLLNDGLRLRGRNALIAYLTHMNRVPLPWGGFATRAKHLSELLLMDVEAGGCQKASRIEEAVSAVHQFIQRARLGLEAGFPITPGFLLGWERHFVAFRTWEACKRRYIYGENTVEWDQLAEARETEAFRFLESELRSATLTMPIPGGLTHWSGPRPAVHPGITLLQHNEPATMQHLQPAPGGFELMGTPDRHARPTWLAPINNQAAGLTPSLPMWLQAAVRLGTRFIRVAAAGMPPASTTFKPKCGPSTTSLCCTTCGKMHPPLIDEYYFWIEESQYYGEKEQVAEWGAVADDPQTDWHRTEKLPGLLKWDSRSMVHLRWCRVHNGEFQQPRQSFEGVKIKAGASPGLVFLGRSGDSLHFDVTGAEVPVIGYAPPPPAPGFRYDLAADQAIPLPQVVATPEPGPVGGLAAFPFFAWFDPGAPLLPPSLFSPAIAVAGHLRSHCRFEAALKWYEQVYNPLLKNNTWMSWPPKQTPGLPPEEGAGKGCCASDPVSDDERKERAILLHYLETLLQWGDALMRKNTPEAFQQARLIFDTAAKILGPVPITVLARDKSDQAPTVINFKPECAPLNPRLMCLYTGVSDRLSLIHTCLNAKRLHNGRPNVDMPYFGNSAIRECWQGAVDVCAAEGDWCMPQSPYRFMVLVQKAQEIAGDVRALGGALLSAYEKGDGEYLSVMRTIHEQQLLNLTLEVRQNQWREADWQVQALQKTKRITQTRLNNYINLLAEGLITGEDNYKALTITSTILRAAGNITEGIGQVMNVVPDPFVGFPSNFVKLPAGTKMSMMFSAAARIVNTAADIINTKASLENFDASMERRAAEWQHQIDVLTIEVQQIERQILAAERRRDIALRELNNHQQQIENAAEVQNFLRDKFTNHALYLWMQQETAALYYQAYEMALHCARQAQRAFNFERGHTSRQFIPAEMWDNLHEGLLAGERLQFALRLMERAYYDENVREYELNKHISLRVHFPMQFLQLKTTGYCEIDIHEWRFDLDYPGHYMRRIKNVTMSVPVVSGPYTGVHCHLTLLSSKTRVDPRLLEPPHTCCHDKRCKNGYHALPEDPRIVSVYGATEAIATSSGQNDSGMFELNFRDDRYLPFEYAGAVSRWRIELPLENNHFDMETLSDVVLHLNFTAREGGENLRKAANQCAQLNLPGGGVRFFDVRHELSDAWHMFTCVAADSHVPRQLAIRLSKTMFPYLTGNKRIGVKRLEIFFEAPGADPSKHHMVEFLARHHVHSIACVADAGWPGLFHGVLEIDCRELHLTGCHDLGVFRFPADVGEITDTYLFCGYSIL